MNPFILSPQDRLQNWKTFRKGLPQLSEDLQLQAVADYFALAPLSRIAYDCERPDTWTSPWEMISAGDWCRNSVAIGMEFTLRLAGWRDDRLRLAMMRDDDLSQLIMVVIIDEKQLLNYNHSSVSPLSETHHCFVNILRFCGKSYVECGF